MNESRCFLFGTLLDPVALDAVAPRARFERIAHLPAHRLGFSRSGMAVVVPDEGHSVWGGVFALSGVDIAEVGRHLGDETTQLAAWAVDRDGERFEVVAFSGPDGGSATEEQVAQMVRGARHWELPAGWIVGLEDLVDPFEF